MEEWREIEGYPNYAVSNLGRVRGPRKDSLKLVDGGQGYVKVTLSKNGKHVDKRVNRLVATAFLPNPENHPIVMHLDNNRANNHVDNLQWGTHLENNRWCAQCGRHANTLTDETREKAFAARRKPVIAINTADGTRTRYISQHDAARSLGVMQQHIWGVLNGNRRSTGGYRFEYADKEVSDDV